MNSVNIDERRKSAVINSISNIGRAFDDGNTDAADDLLYRLSQYVAENNIPTEYARKLMSENL
jgi:hypothetical protein